MTLAVGSRSVGRSSTTLPPCISSSASSVMLSECSSVAIMSLAASMTRSAVRTMSSPSPPAHPATYGML